MRLPPQMLPLVTMLCLKTAHSNPSTEGGWVVLTWNLSMLLTCRSPYMRLLNDLADNPLLKEVRGEKERDDEQVSSQLTPPIYLQLCTDPSCCVRTDPISQ